MRAVCGAGYASVMGVDSSLAAEGARGGRGRGGGGGGGGGRGGRG